MHILENTLTEREITKNFFNTYTPKSTWEKYFSFGKSFKSLYKNFALKKEEILQNYSSVLSDIQKDIKNPDVTPSDLENTRQSILFITQTIQECGNWLEKMKPSNSMQWEIFTHEERFFVLLIESFRNDLRWWLVIHAHEVSQKSDKLESEKQATNLQEWKALLELQKKRLQSIVNNISKI